MRTGYGVRGAPSFGFDRTVLPLADAISAVARRLWPIKTARNLASRAGTTHRAAEQWLSGQTGISGDALAELLRSDAGLEVLESLMGGVRPSWWPAFRADARAAGIAARLDALSKDIDEARRGLS